MRDERPHTCLYQILIVILCVFPSWVKREKYTLCWLFFILSRPRNEAVWLELIQPNSSYSQSCVVQLDSQNNTNICFTLCVNSKIFGFPDKWKRKRKVLEVLMSCSTTSRTDCRMRSMDTVVALVQLWTGRTPQSYFFRRVLVSWFRAERLGFSGSHSHRWAAGQS